MERNASVVVLGYGTEEHLESCLRAIVDELGPDDELVLVDNDIMDSVRRRPHWDERVRVVGDGRNTGFAGGCNLGAAVARGDVLVFVNSDAVVRPGSLAPLVAAAREPSVGIAGGCLRLADEPDLVNSVGNPLQFAGLTWAGSCGEPADGHTVRGPVPVATGGFFAVRRDVWDDLGGFDPLYFAYHEDTDLSVRCWLAGYEVVYVPEGVADHHYEFSRNPFKMYLVERNRLVTVLTDYPAPLLRRVLPAVVLLEPMFLVLAVLQGWPRQKLSSWWWLARHAGRLRRRRRDVQAAVRVAAPAAVLASLMTDRIEPPMVAAPPGMGLVNGLLAAYWRVVRRGAALGARR